jgi:3-phosphoshikimate 1-carboxyvinyltransferase
MNSITVTASEHPLQGSVNLPLSKSISNRALIIAALSDGLVDHGPLSEAEDTVLLKKLLAQAADGSEQKLFCGNAGTVLRFLTAYLAIRPGKWVLDGDERMRQRPVGPLVDALQQLGADIKYEKEEGYPPLIIHGKELAGGRVQLNADISSQYTSALMMIAPMMRKGLQIQLRGGTVSLPYIYMTERMMSLAGASIKLDLPDIRVKSKAFTKSSLPAELDWSAAAAWYQVVSLSKKAKIFIPGLRENTLQGDQVMHKYFLLLGVETEFKPKGAFLSKSHWCGQACNFDLTGYPDLAPALIVTAAARGKKGHFMGLVNLRIKESDRMGAIATELEKAGVKCTIYQDELFFDPQILNITQPVETYNDHRIAMAFAPLAMLGRPVTINNPEVVRKSYPHFWEELKKVLRVEG